MFQVNDYWNPQYDVERLRTDWKYNVDAGLRNLKDAYDHAVKAKEPNVPAATYSRYNGGSRAQDRYRTATDPRDAGFAKQYNSESWLQ